VGLGAFWLAVLAAIIDLLLSLTAGTAVASTGVGAPPAAAGCVAALVKFVGFLVAIVTAFTAFVMWAAAPGIKDLWQNLNNNTAFPGGHWPGADLPGGWQIGRA